MDSRLQKAGGGLRASTKTSTALIALLVIFRISCCQGAKTESDQPEANLELLTDKDTQPLKDASGLEKDVDDPQGVYPQKRPVQRLSSSLILEGDEESSGQASDNAADINAGRRKRSLRVGPGTGLEDWSLRHRRLNVLWKRGLSPATPPLSSLGSETKMQRARREAGHLILPTDSPQTAEGSMRSKLPSDADMKQPSIQQKRSGQPVFWWLSRPVTEPTGSTRHRRDTKEQQPHGTYLRQTDNEGDNFDNDRNDTDDNEKNGSDDGDSDDDETNGSETQKERKKRKSSFFNYENSERMPQHDVSLRQQNGVTESLSSVKRKKRQSDLDDVNDTNDDKNSVEGDGDDDGGDDNNDDNENDSVDEETLKRKREASGGQGAGEQSQQSVQKEKDNSQNVAPTVRSKRQDTVLQAIAKVSDDDDDYDDDEDQDDSVTNRFTDGLEIGSVRRKRQYPTLKRILREEPTPVVADSDSDDSDDDDDDSDDTLKNALADMLDEMVDNDEDISGTPLRRKRSVREFVESGKLHRSQRSSPAIRQVIQEMAEEEDDEDEDEDIPSDDLILRKRSSDLKSEHKRRRSKREYKEDVSDLIGAVAQTNEDAADDDEIEETKLNDIALDMAAEGIRDPDDFDDDSGESVAPILKTRRHVDRKAPRHKRELIHAQLLEKDNPGFSKNPTVQVLEMKTSIFHQTGNTNADVTLNLPDQNNRGAKSNMVSETNGMNTRMKRSIGRTVMPLDVNDSDGSNIPLNHPTTRNSSGPGILPIVSFISEKKAAVPLPAKTKVSKIIVSTKRKNNDNVTAGKLNRLLPGLLQTTDIVTHSWSDNNNTKQPADANMIASDSRTNVTEQILASGIDSKSSNKTNTLSLRSGASGTSEETLISEEISRPPNSARRDNAAATREGEYRNVTETEPKSVGQLMDDSTRLNATANSLSNIANQSLVKKSQKGNVAQQPFRRSKTGRLVRTARDKMTLESIGLVNHHRQRRSVHASNRDPNPPQMQKRSVVVIQPGFDSTGQAQDVVTKYKDADRTLQDILDNVLGPVPNPVPNPIPAVIQVTPDDDDDDNDEDDDNDDDDNGINLSNDAKRGFIALSTMDRIKNEREKAKNKVRIEKMKAQHTVRNEKHRAKQVLAKERKKAKSQLSLEKNKAKEELRQEQQLAKLALKEEERKAKQKIAKLALKEEVRNAKQRIHEMLDYPNGRFARDVSSDLENQLKEVMKNVQPEKVTKETTNKENDQSVNILLRGQPIPSFPVTEDKMSRKLTDGKTFTSSDRLSEKEKEKIVAETAYVIDQAVHSVLKHIDENIRKTRDARGYVIQELFKSDIENEMEENSNESAELPDDKFRRSVDDTTDNNHKTGDEGRKKRSSKDSYHEDNAKVFDDLEEEIDEDSINKENAQLAKRRSVSPPNNGFQALTDQQSLFDTDDDEDEEEDNKKDVLPGDTVTNMARKKEPGGQNKEELEEALVFEEEDEDGPNSGYTEWSEWGSCSVTCGIGRRQRTRTCEDQGRCHAGNVEEDVCMMEKCQTVAV